MAKDKAPKVPVACVKTWSRLQTAPRGDTRGEMGREVRVTGVRKDLRLLRMDGLVNGCIRA